MGATRSPIEFLQRAGLVDETRQPASRLDVGALLINFLPLEETQQHRRVLQGYEGAPPPDRGPTRPWPSVE